MSAEDSYAVLEQAKSDGKIRHWGVSVNTVPESETAVSQNRAATLQMEYNVINQSAAGAFAAAKSECGGGGTVAAGGHAEASRRVISASGLPWLPCEALWQDAAHHPTMEIR
jgi:hypothetical protein